MTSLNAKVAEVLHSAPLNMSIMRNCLCHGDVFGPRLFSWDGCGSVYQSYNTMWHYHHHNLTHISHYLFYNWSIVCCQNKNYYLRHATLDILCFYKVFFSITMIIIIIDCKMNALRSNNFLIQNETKRKNPDEIKF